MADKHNDNIPAVANTIVADIAKIKENLEFHKDCIESITNGWNNTTAASLTLKNDTIAEKTAASGVTVDGCLIKDGVAAAATKHGVLNVSVVEIGDWNMDTTEAVAITHGVTVDNIRNVVATIRPDAGSGQYYYFAVPYSGIYTDAGVFVGYPGVYITAIGAETLSLTRTTGSPFDGTNFNATSYNRGWVTIWYVD